MLDFSYWSDAEGFVMWDDENKDNKTCYRPKIFSIKTPRYFPVAAQLVLPARRSVYEQSSLLVFGYDSVLCQKVSSSKAKLTNKLYLRSSFERTKPKTGKVREKLSKDCNKIISDTVGSFHL